MIELVEEFISFKTNKIIEDQARMILNKGWFSCLELLEISLLVRHKENNKQDATIHTKQDTPK